MYRPHLQLQDLAGTNNAHLLNVDDVTILFSYDTPVACFVPGKGYAMTDYSDLSITTRRHIRAWTMTALPLLPRILDVDLRDLIVRRPGAPVYFRLEK